MNELEQLVTQLLRTWDDAEMDEREGGIPTDIADVIGALRKASRTFDGRDS